MTICPLIRYNKSIISIYGIKNSKGQIYYIGRTKDVAQRKRQHKYLGRPGDLVILATCDASDAVAVERVYIAKYRNSIENKKERYYTGVSIEQIQRNR